MMSMLLFKAFVVSGVSGEWKAASGGVELIFAKTPQPKRA
jgi:hypothetical protein